MDLINTKLNNLATTFNKDILMVKLPIQLLWSGMITARTLLATAVKSWENFPQHQLVRRPILNGLSPRLNPFQTKKALAFAIGHQTVWHLMIMETPQQMVALGKINACLNLTIRRYQSLMFLDTISIYFSF